MKKLSPPDPARLPFPSNLAAFGVLALAAALAPAPSFAQESLGDLEEILVTGPRRERGLDLGASIQLYGHVQASFTTNLAAPSQRKGANRLRLSDPDHNAFAIPYAKVGVARTLSGLNEFDAGFRFEVGAGRMVEEVFEDPTLGDRGVTIPQAYVDLQIPTPYRGLQLRLGRQYSWFGVESLDLYKNPSFSLSPLALASPRTVTGASLGMDLGGGLRYTQHLVQGWDRVEDDNDSFTLGGQLAWKTDRLALALNWIAGPERAGNDDDLRWALELSARYRATGSLDLRAAVLYGQEAFADGTAKFGGASLAVRQGLFEVEGEDLRRLSLSLRGSYLRDQGGSRTGIDQALGEVTATFALNFTQTSSLRLEYRHDESSADDAFLGRRGQASRSRQDTLALAFHFAF
ncbi:MAG TPA: hypothetical protein DEA08_06395 [Planctomycetes bacterium]|nr:hypothetical protein [Planctomycetota bacterium]